MALPIWSVSLLIGIDFLVVLYGLEAAIRKRKTYGWFLALAFALFGIKETLPYCGIVLTSGAVLALTTAGLATALCAFALIVRSLPL